MSYNLATETSNRDSIPEPRSSQELFHEVMRDMEGSLVANSKNKEVHVSLWLT